MDLSERMHIGARVVELYDLVADLGTYPDWLGFVVRADPEPDETRDVRGSWIVELRGRIGPFARSKRLRMVRTASDRPHHVRFERTETDARAHSPWRLEVWVDAENSGSVLTMDLHYGGSRFAPVLAPILRDEIGKGRRALEERYPPLQ